MDNLLNSRLKEDDQKQQVQHLSPQKYGKAAYCKLTYTPSKLVDSYLYKEVATMKKVEEESSKARESGTMIEFLQERLTQTQEQRDGIQSSLNQQISMYKKMIQEMEIKHENRIKNIQSKFKEEINKIISEKEEEAKYTQSQQELLQDRISQLEQQNTNLNQRLGNKGDDFVRLENDFSKLQIEHTHTKEKLNEANKRITQEETKARETIQELDRKLYKKELDWKNKLQNQARENQKEKDAIAREHKLEIEAVQAKRANQALLKSQELAQLSRSFEKQMDRHNDYLRQKEANLRECLQDKNRQQERLLELTEHCESETNHHAHQKARLLEELQALSSENTVLRDNFKKEQLIHQQHSSEIEDTIHYLRKDFEQRQTVLINERNRLETVIADLHNELLSVRTGTLRAQQYSYENNALRKEIAKLKELLLESSDQLQKCKEQFIRLRAQKQNLLYELKEQGYSNEALQKMTSYHEQEAIQWKSRYLASH